MGADAGPGITVGAAGSVGAVGGETADKTVAAVGAAPAGDQTELQDTAVASGAVDAESSAGSDAGLLVTPGNHALAAAEMVGLMAGLTSDSEISGAAVVLTAATAAGVVGVVLVLAVAGGAVLGVRFGVAVEEAVVARGVVLETAVVVTAAAAAVVVTVTSVVAAA